MVPTSAGDEDTSTRTRILEATFKVLGRKGHTKLNLSDVAAEAGVSRPTLYYWFSSKDDLLNAFGDYEQHVCDQGIEAAMAGLEGVDRVDAALRFIVDYKHSFSLGTMVAVEPEHVVFEMARSIPVMRERIRQALGGPNADRAASAAVRIAICHYLVEGDDEAEFLAQLRYAVGIDPPA